MEFDQAVSNIFGYHALQLGFAELDALRANRMPHKWLTTALPYPSANSETTVDVSSSRPRAAMVTDSGALPFSANSLDLLVLPHTLELSQDPHATLREVERVLVPEGRPYAPSWWCGASRALAPATFVRCQPRGWSHQFHF